MGLKCLEEGAQKWGQQLGQEGKRLGGEEGRLRKPLEWTECEAGGSGGCWLQREADDVLWPP